MVVKDRKTVIEALQYLISEDCTDTQFDYADEIEAAIVLLKEQELRMLTLEELEKIYTAKKTHVWPFNSPPYMWLTVNPAVPLTTGYWICWRDIRDCLENNHLAYLRENYGKVWRIWTKEPTDEQMKAVKWE